jgi:hypothetical protein
MVFDVVQMNAHMEWEHALPMWLGHAMHAIENVAMPVIILLGAYAMLLVWTNSRAGYAIIAVISVLNIALNAPTTFWRTGSGFIQGAVICGVEALIGLLALYYAIAGLRTPTRQAEPERVTA